MNSKITDKIIKYLQLMDENIIIMENFINLKENLNSLIEEDVILKVFKSSINILKLLYKTLKQKEDFVNYNSGLLCEINLLLKKVYNEDINYNNDIELINIIKYLINLIQTIKKMIMPIEEIITIYPELSSLSKFHNINFYKLFILSYKVNQDFLDDEHVFITEGKNKSHLLKKYNYDLTQILSELENNNFINIRRKDSFLNIEFNLYRLHPSLLHLGKIEVLIYKYSDSVFKLKSNLNKLKERVDYIALVMSNIRGF